MGDAALLAPLLIPEDVENAAAVGMTPEAAISESIRASEKTMVVLLDGVIASMMGVARKPVGPLFWLVTSTTARSSPRSYLRAASDAFRFICGGESHLVSIVGAAHDRAIRLGGLFGFKASEPIEVEGHQRIRILRWERS